MSSVLLDDSVSVITRLEFHYFSDFTLRFIDPFSVLQFGSSTRFRSYNLVHWPERRDFKADFGYFVTRWPETVTDHRRQPTYEGINELQRPQQHVTGPPERRVHDPLVGEPSAEVAAPDHQHQRVIGDVSDEDEQHHPEPEPRLVEGVRYTCVRQNRVIGGSGFRGSVRSPITPLPIIELMKLKLAHGRLDLFSPSSSSSCGWIMGLVFWRFGWGSDLLWAAVSCHRTRFRLILCYCPANNSRYLRGCDREKAAEGRKEPGKPQIATSSFRRCSLGCITRRRTKARRAERHATTQKRTKATPSHPILGQLVVPLLQDEALLVRCHGPRFGGWRRLPGSWMGWCGGCLLWIREIPGNVTLTSFYRFKGGRAGVPGRADLVRVAWMEGGLGERGLFVGFNVRFFCFDVCWIFGTLDITKFFESCYFNDSQI